MEECALDTSIRTLGPCKLESHLPYRTWADDKRIQIFVDEELSEHNGKACCVCFEAAGPRKKLYFDSSRAKCAIVTCGGLCPGINDVIRAIVMEAYHAYNVPSIVGIPYGLEGFIPKSRHAMRELTIGKNDAGQRVDRFVSKALPLLPPALLQKYIRLKRIKVNGGRAQRDQRLREGDVLQLYINDEFFDKPREDNLFLTLFRPSLDIVYEDENLMLLNKRPGLVVHADETEKVNTLINHIQAYLYQKREWNPRWENAFTPALCNRIDRNTGGIVIAAKNAETLRIINQKIRDREIDKRYLCITVGTPRPPQGEVSCFLLKDEKKKQVAVYHRPVPGGKTAVTRYRTLETRGELSLLEVELLTGRTHQIRATMADLGCPLLGDGKYGDGQVNRRYGETRQALYSYRLTFDFPTDAGLLNYLRGRSFQVESVPFREKYFG